VHAAGTEDQQLAHSSASYDHEPCTTSLAQVNVFTCYFNNILALSLLLLTAKQNYLYLIASAVQCRAIIWQFSVTTYGEMVFIQLLTILVNINISKCII